MARAAVLEQYGESAYVSGIRVETTIRRQDQEAANAGLRQGVLDYDRRHGYRGPEAYVSLPAGSGPEIEEAVEEALQDREPVGDLVAAVVVEATPREVVAVMRRGDVVKVGGDGLKFVARALVERSNPDRASPPGGGDSPDARREGGMEHRAGAQDRGGLRGARPDSGSNEAGAPSRGLGSRGERDGPGSAGRDRAPVSAAVLAFNSNPGAAVVYGDALSIDAEGKPFNIMRARKYTLVALMAFNIICHPAAFMRRSALEQVKYLNPSYHLLMDNLLWMNLARIAPLVYVPQTWAAARYHDQAKNRTRGAAYGREAKSLLKELEGNPEFSGIITSHWKRSWAGANRFDAFYLTDAGQPGEALRAYGRRGARRGPA